jgi:CheY-like chemotaxis protein
MAYILILDTQAQFRQRLIRLIEQAGHRATAVATIGEATRVINEITPDRLQRTWL